MTQGYKIKSNNNPLPFGIAETLEARLLSIGLWLCNGDVDNQNYLQCLETAFEHWGWTPPIRHRKTTPKRVKQPETFFEED